MSNLVQNDRWKVPTGDFAAKVTIPDLKGFFGAIPKGRTIIVEPGTKAFLVDNGYVYGEVRPGSYTLETILEQLQFWQSRQSTLILTRSEEITLESVIRGIPTQEGVCVNLAFSLSIKIGDLSSFVENLMGANAKVSIEDLHSKLCPIIDQAVSTAVGFQPIAEVFKPRFTEILIGDLHQSLDHKFTRLGLKFIDIVSLKVTHKNSETFAQEQTDQFLRDRETDLIESGSRVGNDNLRARIDSLKGRIPLRDELRKAFQEEKFLKIQNEQEFDAFMAEVDKSKLLKREEAEELRRAYEERKEDRAEIREHLTKTLDIQRERDIDELRSEIRHAFKIKGLEQEIELSKVSNQLDKQSWAQELEFEKSKAEAEREEKLKQIRGKWERVKEFQLNQRDESWKALLHQKQVEEVQAEIEIAKAQRSKQIAIIEQEIRQRVEHEKLELKRRQEELEIEIRQKRSDNQIDRLAKIQEMNLRSAEKQQRLQVELENLKAESDHTREMNRISAMGNLSTEALIATSQATNASLLADLKKHEVTQNLSQHKMESQAAERLNEERLKLYQQMNDAEKTKAEAIAEAYKMAMQAQMGSVNQMISGLTQVAKPQPTVVGNTAPPAAPRVDSWHAVINGEQVGPMTLAQMRKHIMEQRITLASMVWKTGLSAWIQADQAAELLSIFSELEAATPPPFFGGGPPPLN